VLDANYQQHKICLAGIDAPERKQAYGLASRKHLALIVAGKQVTVEYQKRDRYGRIVGKVLHDGIDVCLEQVKTRSAWHYLWRENNPNPPWEYRRLWCRKRRKTSLRDSLGDVLALLY
jgi:endonuclease YncB( thermonuclease family)